VSLGDRPANDDCRFALVKSVGLDEWKDMQTGMVLKREGISVKAMSYEQIRDKINGMVGYDCWVMETYPDHVIVCERDKYYKIPYSLGEGDSVTLGPREEVQQTYEPVQKAAARKAAGKDEEEQVCKECGKPMKPGEEHKCSKEADGDEEEGNDGKAATPDGGAAAPDSVKAGKKMSADRLARFLEIKNQIDALLSELEDPPAVDEGGDDAGKAATDGVPISGKLDFYSLAVIKEVRAQLQALAAQVDAALKGLDPGVPGGASSIPATKHDANPGDPTYISAADLPKLVAAEFAKLLSIPQDKLEKAATPDATHSLFADAVKAVVADAVKTAVDTTIGGLTERLEKVEQMAAPARGALMEVEKIFAGNPENVVSDIRKAVDLLTSTAQDQSEEAQLKRAQAIYQLSNLARKGA
jgi:tetrahydromethanopterin S-methyltransferase subunit B